MRAITSITGRGRSVFAAQTRDSGDEDGFNQMATGSIVASAREGGDDSVGYEERKGAPIVAIVQGIRRR